MAFTNIGKGKVILNADDPDNHPTAYFHPQDISAVLGQPEAQGIRMVKARVNEIPCTVIVAVTDLTEVGFGRMLDGEDNLVALTCPPFTDREGGLFMSNPGGGQIV